MNRRELLAGAAAATLTPTSPWKSLAEGLELGVFDAAKKSALGDSKIHVLRIDCSRRAPMLLNASAAGAKSRTAREWCEKAGAVAAINAAMFKPDGKGTGRMKTSAHVNNAALSADKSLLVFDPIAKSLPPVALLDRDCDSFEDADARWGTQVQSIRMVTCTGKNVWAQQPRSWSTAAIGTDTKGRLLFLHSRSPWSTHDFIELLLALPIDLSRAMYTEGGPEAQLYVKSGSVELERVGSYETGFNENDDNTAAWPIPNVVAIR